MIKTVGSIEIDRNIRDVFQYTTDNVAEWSLTVVEDEPLNTTPDMVGSTFRCVTEDHGHRMEFQGEVTLYDDPHVSAVRLTGRHFDIDAAYQFEDLGGRTKVTQTSRVYPKGMMMRLFFGLCGWMMKKGSCDAINKELASLKSHLEQPAGE